MRKATSLAPIKAAILRSIRLSYLKNAWQTVRVFGEEFVFIFKEMARINDWQCCG